MKFALLFSLIILFVSCQNEYPQEVQDALNLSGDNRLELENVLEFYKKTDRRKYESACFLISNMKYHKSKQFIDLDSSYHHYFSDEESQFHKIFIQIDSLPFSKHMGFDELRKNLAKDFKQLSNPLISNNYLNDLQIVKSEFLIDNIELAFEEWENSPFAKELNFDEFKEFILPYRTTDESLLLKRSDIRKRWKNKIESNGFSNIVQPIGKYKTYVEKCRWINYYTKPQEHIGIYDLFIPKFKMDCHNLTNWTCNIFRSCGIPVVYEYTPQWKDRDRRHFWCVSPDSLGILQPYTAPENNLLEDWESDIKYASKVYRKGFAANKKSPYFLINENEYIPEELVSPLIIDQTFRYHQTITLRLGINIDSINNNLAYLCVFKDGELNPVGWGVIDKKSKQVKFEQLPLNTVFVPAIYSEEGMIQIDNPFLIYSSNPISEIAMPLTTNKYENPVDCTIQDGKIYCKKNQLLNNKLQYIPISPNGKFIEDMIILRKYPEKRRLKLLQQNLIGAFFTGSNMDEGNSDTLNVLTNAPIPYLQEISLNNNKAYRYYRFFTPEIQPVNIAHMEFLGPFDKRHKCLEPTPLPITSANDTFPDKGKLFRFNGIPWITGSNPEAAYDNDYETYVGAAKIGMDFSVPVVITYIRFLPRNANNIIRVGDNYKLMYHDGFQWKEHGEMKAKYNFLSFRNVPEGTLYWLINTTSGNEELPFFYNEGKQYFMNLEFPFKQFKHQ